MSSRIVAVTSAKSPNRNSLPFYPEKSYVAINPQFDLHFDITMPPSNARTSPQQRSRGQVRRVSLDKAPGREVLQTESYTQILDILLPELCPLSDAYLRHRYCLTHSCSFPSSYSHCLAMELAMSRILIF